MESENTNVDQQTAIGDDPIDQIIGEVVGKQPDEELETVIDDEESFEDTRTDDEQADKQPDPAAANVETPVDEEEVEIVAQPDYTPRETSLYARMKKMQTQRDEARAKSSGGGEVSQLQQQIARLQAKVDEIGPTPKQPEEELVDPLAELDPDDVPTVSQYQEYNVYLQKKAEKAARQREQLQYDNSMQYLHAATVAGKAIYDDWDAVVEPAFEKFKADGTLDNLFKAGNPAKAARLAYEKAKGLNQRANGSPATQISDQQIQAAINETKYQNSQPTQKISMKQLTPVQYEKVMTAISNCDSEEQCDELMRRLGLSY